MYSYFLNNSNNCINISEHQSIYFLTYSYSVFKTITIHSVTKCRKIR